MESSLKRYWLFTLVFGFLTGVALASTHFVGLSLSIFLMFLSCVLAGYVLGFVKENPVRNIFILIIVFCTASSLGIIRFTTDYLPVDPTLASTVDKKTEITGVVVAEPKQGDSYRQYIVETSTHVRVVVRAQPFPHYEFGDQLVIQGKLELPKTFQTDTGATFDYPAYLEKEGISYVMSFVTVQKTGEIHSVKYTVEKFLFAIKDHFVSAFERVIAYPESGLLAGILLGVDDAMGKDLLNTFRLVGIIHIVVLSGYNITIVAESIRKALSFLSLRKALLFSVIGIIIFSTMVGWTPSVVRASIMAILAITAKATRRNYDVGRALALAALVMVVWNPRVLMYDLGFELSFLATVALIWLSPIIIKKLGFIPEKFGFRDIVGTTITVQLFVLPLLVYSSGIISLGGFIVNLLVLPFVPLVMALGFVTGTLGLISSYLAFIPGAVTHFLLFYIICISQTFARLPGSVLTITNVSSYVPVFLYTLFAIVVLYIKTRAHRFRGAL